MLCDLLRVSKDVGVPEAESRDALLRDPRIAVAICDAVCVLATIRFDRQLCLGAEEIDDEWTNRYLTAEFITAKAAIAEQAPKLLFSFCLPASEVARKGCLN